MVPAPAYLQSSSQTQTQTQPTTSSSHDAILKLKASNRASAAPSSTQTSTTTATITTTQSRLSAPLKLTDAFSKRGIEHFNHTPAIGTEFEKGQLDLAELLERPDGDEEADELLRELAVMSEFGIASYLVYLASHASFLVPRRPTFLSFLPSTFCFQARDSHSPHMPPRIRSRPFHLSGGRSSTLSVNQAAEQAIHRDMNKQAAVVAYMRGIYCSLCRVCKRPLVSLSYLSLSKAGASDGREAEIRKHVEFSNRSWSSRKSITPVANATSLHTLSSSALAMTRFRTTMCPEWLVKSFSWQHAISHV